jgi:hypothetical protein
MKFKKHIATYSAYLMLVLFVLNACPKQFLHNICTNHTHNAIQKKSNCTAVVSNGGIKCVLDNFEVEAPFTPAQNLYVLLQIGIYKNVLIKKASSYCFNSIAVHQLRGPPAFG